jgi:hypothetical protein
VANRVYGQIVNKDLIRRNTQHTCYLRIDILDLIGFSMSGNVGIAGMKGIYFGCFLVGYEENAVRTDPAEDKVTEFDDL